MLGITFLSMFFVILKIIDWRDVFTKSKFNKFPISHTFLAMLAKCMWLSKALQQARIVTAFLITKSLFLFVGSQSFLW